jgi:serine/threonine protein kinase
MSVDPGATRVAPTQPRGLTTQPPAALTSVLPAGTVIAGRFTLEAPAGRGGMGTVYRATDSLSGRCVALKLLHDAPSADTARRFTQEAELLSALHHPGIVAYVAHGHSEPGQPFLAMEWLEGEDLSQRLARQPLSVAETLSLLRHTARALAVAHQHGVIHRDLKPSNLFLRGGNPTDVVLLDFGLARHTEPATAMTASQVLLGTPGYMAPEQISQQSQPTPSVDVFSLGCVLYECLTAQPPFRAPHLMATLASILFHEPASLRELRPELPAALQTLLERMLVKDPARRLADASQLLGALEELPVHLEPCPGTEPLAAPPATSRLGPRRQDRARLRPHHLRLAPARRLTCRKAAGRSASTPVDMSKAVGPASFQVFLPGKAGVAASRRSARALL